MSAHELAGGPVPPEMIIDVPELIGKYFDVVPDASVPEQQVSFGTSGHRGTSSSGGFNEAHIVAISAAICDYREANGIDGPLFLGMDTHALSESAHTTAIEVMAARGVELRVAPGLTYTPTPAVSHAILTANRDSSGASADGIVITPSHNPPEDGGFKYNPPNGGPADTDVTRWIQNRANEILRADWKSVPRTALKSALSESNVREHDFRSGYVDDLNSVIDMQAIREAALNLGVDPMGGAAVHYWDYLADRYGLTLEVVNREVDPTFSFMSVDRDGKVRMDCSSPWAMASLIGLSERFDLAFGNDPDVDRHGIVTRSSGLLNPNHYLAVAIWYLFQHRPEWSRRMGIGKTLVSSSMIDRVADELSRELVEVPVGFKWFVDGLIGGKIAFAGEESAGATFLRKDGSVWTTDKDGILLDLLAAEITAVTGRDPGEHYQDLEARHGTPVYRRIEAPASTQEKAILKDLADDAVHAKVMAGEPIKRILTRAAGNGAAIGGLKVVTENGWFAARPSGTEDIYKIYAESFKGDEHIDRILAEAQEIVNAALE